MLILCLFLNYTIRELYLVQHSTMGTFYTIYKLLSHYELIQVQM